MLCQLAKRSQRALILKFASRKAFRLRNSFRMFINPFHTSSFHETANFFRAREINHRIEWFTSAKTFCQQGWPRLPDKCNFSPMTPSDFSDEFYHSVVCFDIYLLNHKPCFNYSVVSLVTSNTYDIYKRLLYVTLYIFLLFWPACSQTGTSAKKAIFVIFYEWVETWSTCSTKSTTWN